MNIFNVRYGFATNSSSTHSLITIPSGNTGIYDSGTSGSEFGWENFTCVSKEAKQRYLSLLLRQHFTKQQDLDSIDAGFFNYLMGISEDEFISSLEGYIDHQSEISLPTNFNGHGLDINFFKEFANFILSPNVAILGGNDNNDYDHPLLNHYKKIEIPFFLDTSDRLVARWDEQGKFWTLFNRDRGTKLRFSFVRDIDTPKRSEVPELVDVKITDKCFSACPYCYQGSTPRGDETDTSYLYYLAEQFAKERIFEVAIGGGEPTTHPKFIYILEMFKSRGVIPNFTTRSLSWFKDYTFTSILPLIGSFAYSVETPKQIRELRTTLDYHKDLIEQVRHSPLNVNIHIVMGLHHDWQFRNLIRECLECNFTPILLGFKTTGRGAKTKQIPYDNWFHDIQEIFTELKMYRRIGIDTVMAEQYGDLLEENGVPSILYHKGEGTFSCYVDAVKQTLAKSSFQTTEEIPLGYNELEEFKTLYQSLVKV